MDGQVPEQISVGSILTCSVAGMARDEAVVTTSMMRMESKAKQLSATRSRRDSARQCRDARVIYPTSTTGSPPPFARLM